MSDQVIAKVGSFDITLREPRYLFAVDTRTNCVVWSVELPTEVPVEQPVRELIDVQHELAARLQEAEALLREPTRWFGALPPNWRERAIAFLERRT